MSIYRRNDDMQPDSDFEPGELRHLVAGNAGRLLDPRRTPVCLAGVDSDRGLFQVRIEGFEDHGAVWDVPYEHVSHYQFARGATEATDDEQALFCEMIARFDQPLEIPCDPEASAKTNELLRRGQHDARDWLADHSTFVAAGAELPPPADRQGDARLCDDLQRFMAERDLWAIEAAFARQFVCNPDSGELVKGHCMVLAEMGLVPFVGKVVRSPDLFDGGWSRAQRTRHVLARLAFIRALFACLGREHLVVYRGLSTDVSLRDPCNDTFVSATTNREVADSHFTAVGPSSAGVLMRRAVPVTRIFMTYFETAAMNEQYREAEVVLLFDEGNALL